MCNHPPMKTTFALILIESDTSFDEKPDLFEHIDI